LEVQGGQPCDRNGGSLPLVALERQHFDPLNATEKDDKMFRKAKGLMALFGLKETDKLNVREKEIQEALKLWAEYKDSPFDELEP
jgi:hypothetical protein